MLLQTGKWVWPLYREYVPSHRATMCVNGREITWAISDPPPWKEKKNKLGSCFENYEIFWKCSIHFPPRKTICSTLKWIFKAPRCIKTKHSMSSIRILYNFSQKKKPVWNIKRTYGSIFCLVIRKVHLFTLGTRILGLEMYKKVG